MKCGSSSVLKTHCLLFSGRNEPGLVKFKGKVLNHRRNQMKQTINKKSRGPSGETRVEIFCTNTNCNQNANIKNKILPVLAIGKKT